MNIFVEEVVEKRGRDRERRKKKNASRRLSAETV